MGVGAGPYMYVVVVQKFTFAISSPDEFLLVILLTNGQANRHTAGKTVSSLKVVTVIGLK